MKHSFDGGGSAGPTLDPLTETSVDELVRAMTTGSIQVIDVREQEEWDEGRIAGSVLMPMSTFSEYVHTLDPRQPIVTVCRVGARSLYVAEALQAAGFPRVQSLNGGLNAWLASGQPLEG